MEDHGDSGGQGDGGEFADAPGKALSEAELEELQRKNCVFCHIASGSVPAKKVYEDEHCVAVLDINPASPGHVLLMPKEHYTVMFQMPEQLLGHVFLIAKGISQAGLKAFQNKGTTIFTANGVAAGQRAPHFMLHIIPRMPGDNVGLYIPSRALPANEAEQIAAALTAALGGTVKSAATAAKEKSHEEEKSKVAEAEVAKTHDKTATKTENKRPKQTKTDLDAITDFLANGRGGD